MFLKEVERKVVRFQDQALNPTSAVFMKIVTLTNISHLRCNSYECNDKRLKCSVTMCDVNMLELN